MVAQVQGVLPYESGLTSKARPAGLRDMLKMESLKMSKRPMTWITLGLMLLAVIAIPVLGYLAVNSSDYASAAEKAEELRTFLLPNGIELALDITTVVGQILLVVVAAGIIGSEYGWGTTRVLVGSGANRAKLMLAKILQVARFSVIFLVVGGVVGTLASLVITVVSGNDVTLGGVDSGWIADLGLMFARDFLVMMVPVAIGFAVAALSRSLAAGIAVGIGVMALEPVVSALLGIFGNIGDTIRQFLISDNTNAILSLNGLDATSPADGINPWQAAAVLLAYIVIPAVAAIIAFQRRDVPSGS